MDDGIQSTVTQLPRTAIPRHYSLQVTPDAARLRFTGQVAIDLDVVKPTSSLTLNAKELTLGDVAGACNRCHEQFRVAHRVVPPPPLDGPAPRP